MASKSSHFFAGFLFIILGIFLFLKELQIINFSFWGLLLEFWPLCLILMGIAIILKAKGFVVLFLLLAISFVFLNNILSFYVLNSDLNFYDQNVILDSEIIGMNLDLYFGAGKFLIEKGDNNYAFRSKIKSYSENEPEFKYKLDDEDLTIGVASLKQLNTNVPHIDWREDEWDITLAEGVLYDININYGAASAEFDFRDLMVSNLNVDTGASSTTIIFNDYPTKSNINAGVSSFELILPRNYGVLIDVDGGLLSTSLPGFTKNKGKYYNSAYSLAGDNLIINIDAGVSSIDVEYY